MIDITKVYESYIYKNVPEKIFCPEQALSQLLSEEILFANYREIILDGKKCGHTCVLFVNCNDIFAWGCADAEDIPNEEALEKLYNYCVKYPVWGASIWCCMQRKTKPQAAAVNRMKEAKEWPIELDELEENWYDKRMRERII